MICVHGLGGLWCSADTDGDIDKPEASSEVTEANDGSTDAREETAGVSVAEQDTACRLFVKRATVVYTATEAPYEQVVLQSESHVCSH